MGTCATTGWISSQSTCGTWLRGMAVRTPGPWWKLWNTSRSGADSQTWATWLSWPSGSRCRRGPESGPRPRSSAAKSRKTCVFRFYFYTCTIGLSFGLYPGLFWLWRSGKGQSIKVQSRSLSSWTQVTSFSVASLIEKRTVQSASFFKSYCFPLPIARVSSLELNVACTTPWSIYKRQMAQIIPFSIKKQLLTRLRIYPVTE